MLFRDVFRAQYYLSSLEKEMIQAESYLEFFHHFSKPLTQILDDFATQIGEELDQILLPTIAYEMCKAKKKHFLCGETPYDRYKSFFVTQERYTLYALSIPEKYPFLFEMIDGTIKKGFKNLVACLERFKKDYIAIEQEFGIPPNGRVDAVKILKSSDRHRDQQSLLLTFTNGVSIIYKPVDLRPDQLFSQFVTDIGLDSPFNLVCLNTISRESYGWIKFIIPKSCTELQEVQTFYRRAGALLAIAYALNYTDGHCENVLADGSFPILLDGETFFQNYDPSIARYRSILSTLLIEKTDRRRKNKVPYSAFQATRQQRFESLCTHALWSAPHLERTI